MADYLEQLSFEIELPSAEIAQAVRALYDRITELVSEESGSPEGWPDGFADWSAREYGYTGARIEAEGAKLWIYDDAGTVNLQCLAAFLQYVVRTYMPDQCIAFEWAGTCTRPVLDGFGGGAVLVTAHGVTFRATSAIADELVAEWRARRQTADERVSHDESPAVGAAPANWAHDWLEGAARCPACEEDTGMTSSPVRWMGEEYAEAWSCRCGSEWTVWFGESAIAWQGTVYSRDTGERGRRVESIERQSATGAAAACAALSTHG
jgi:hypothetical protein